MWLFLERDKSDLKKKLAHRWHGPFRVQTRKEAVAYELYLPGRSGYRFFPIVHASRLKKISEQKTRPTVRLVDQLDISQRFDFYEELFPEDSWMPKETDGQFTAQQFWMIGTLCPIELTGAKDNS